MMSEQQFDARLKHIEDQYQARREGAIAYRDQEMARLFHDCGWTQEQIAQRMGKRQAWVSKRLIFGRFLNFNPTGLKPTGLTERHFREHWKRTKGTEVQRFAAVAHALEHGIPHGGAALHDKPGLCRSVIDALSDGKWYTVNQITATVEESLLGVTEEQMREAVRNVRLRPPSGHRIETKKIGKKCQYRLAKVKAGPKETRSASPEIIGLYEKVAPLLDELDQLGRAHEFRTSPVVVRMIAVKLRRIFESVLEEVTA